MKRPGKSDPSRPREDDYDYKREFYRSSSVAEDYDFHRFSSPERQKRNRRKWAAISKALREATGVRTILDLPCGTGRFTGALAREGFEIVGSDISIEMLHKAASLETRKRGRQQPAIRGYVQANAEHLPLRNDSLDCVVSIRFMMHVDPVTRVRMLREFHRVSRRWVIIDYRHCYSFRYVLTHTLRQARHRPAAAVARVAQGTREGVRRCRVRDPQCDSRVGAVAVGQVDSARRACLSAAGVWCVAASGVTAAQCSTPRSRAMSPYSGRDSANVHQRPSRGESRSMPPRKTRRRCGHRQQVAQTRSRGRFDPPVTAAHISRAAWLRPAMVARLLLCSSSEPADPDPIPVRDNATVVLYTCRPEAVSSPRDVSVTKLQAA